MSASGVLRNREGRVRVGWRIILFVVLFGLLAVGGGMIAPRGMSGEAGARLLAALAAGWIVLRLDGKAPGALGFRLRAWAPRGLFGGLGLGVGVAAGVVGLIALTGGAFWSGEPGSPIGLLAGGLAALWMFALPAAAEEALLRGYPLQALAEAWGPAWALWATAVVFGLLHLGNPGVSWLGVGNIVMAGLLLGAVYFRTGSLWWATGVHLGWNWALGFGADLPVSGLDLVDTPYLTGHAAGPAWLSGAAFGPEGSIVSGALLAAAAAWVWSWKEQDTDEESGEERALWRPSPPTEATQRG